MASDAEPEDAMRLDSPKDADAAASPEATEAGSHRPDHAQQFFGEPCPKGGLMEALEKTAKTDEPGDTPLFVDKWTAAITRLTEERKALKLEQRAKTKAIRKTIRQKRRTMKNAKKLTDDELAQIVLDRKILQLVQKEEIAARSSANSSTSKAKSMTCEKRFPCSQNRGLQIDPRHRSQRKRQSVKYSAVLTVTDSPSSTEQRTRPPSGVAHSDSIHGMCWQKSLSPPEPSSRAREGQTRHAQP